MVAPHLSHRFSMLRSSRMGHIGPTVTHGFVTPHITEESRDRLRSRTYGRPRPLPCPNRRSGRFDPRMKKAGRSRSVRSCGESPSETSCLLGASLRVGRRSGSLTIGALRAFQVATVDRAAAVVDHQPARSVLDAKPRFVRLGNHDRRPTVGAPHHSHAPNPRAADPEERGWLHLTRPRSHPRRRPCGPTRPA
jgi:hypothetical protein